MSDHTKHSPARHQTDCEAPHPRISNAFGQGITHHPGSNTCSPSIGINEASVNGFQILLSDPERAILELIEQAPRTVQLNECYQILDLMANLRPKLLNELLMYCTSVKVKRLFLLLAKDLNHQWFAKLDIQSFNLGSGCRVIDTGGSFNADFNIVIRPWRDI